MSVWDMRRKDWPRKEHEFTCLGLSLGSTAGAFQTVVMDQSALSNYELKCRWKVR